jgi:hypothetical protein
VTSHRDDRAWLLLSVSTAGAAGTLRVQVWRKLRSLGALYLQQSVCLLPEREETSRQVRRLLDRVRQHGGSARSLRVTFPDPAEQQQVIGELNAARDYFAAPNGPTARAAVQDAAADLAAFEAALASEAPEPGVNRSTPAERRRA